MPMLVRRTVGCCCVAVLMLALSAPALAQRQMFVLDPGKTTVRFTLDDVLHTVSGTFKPRSGTMIFDLSSGAAEGLIVVDAASGDSGNGTRDRKMHKEILESARFPEISFSPTRIAGTLQSGSTVQLEGVFRIHGGEHPVTLPVPIEISGDLVTAKLHFQIPYVAWGMKNPSTFLLRVGKEVDIDILAVGRLQQEQK